MSDVEKRPLGIAQSYEQVINADSQHKMGANCCGFCCDMRRATVLLSSMFLSLGAIDLVILLGAENLRRATIEDFDDDVLLEVLNKSYVIWSIFVGIGVLTNICSIVGALKYNTKLVGINIAWMVRTLRSLDSMFWPFCILSAVSYNRLYYRIR
jgi:hypothetical protein